MSKRKWLVPFLAFGITVLSGCATDQAAKPMTDGDFVQAMGQTNTQVDALLGKGEKDKAVIALTDMAKRNPDRKEPWGRMAKIQFDSGSYSQAIVSAEEVLQRDNTDRMAKSIRAVAGLRVATQSLSDLRNDVELKGNTRADAADLVAVMRETLGEDVLVPPAELQARKMREEEAAKAKAKAKSRAKSKAAPTESHGAGQPAKGGDPFSQLR